MNYREKNLSFEEKFGKKAAQIGYVQMPNVLSQNLNDFGLEPVDYVVISYIWSRRSDQYTAVSLIAHSTGKHSNTVRKSIRKLSNLGYLKRIYSIGDANKYDLTGLIKCIRVYTETGVTPIQNLYIGIDKKDLKKKQSLYTNKRKQNEKLRELRGKAFPDKRVGYN